ncbi:conserved uncharacteriezed protein [Staphylococcus lugdunensis N920143]|nr:conserved uncharacteriezed protein [Staphylococcus lugdunensis N920143]
MVRQLQINKAKAFTLIETMLALFIIQLLLFISISYLSTYHYIQSAHNNNVTLLINQFDFYKSKALRNHQSITLLFSKNSNQIKVIEQHGQKYHFSISNGYIYRISNISLLNFNAQGEINQFGSLYIKYPTATYRIIFNIDQGRIRYEKI